MILPGLVSPHQSKLELSDDDSFELIISGIILMYATQVALIFMVQHLLYARNNPNLYAVRNEWQSVTYETDSVSLNK